MDWKTIVSKNFYQLLYVFVAFLLLLSVCFGSFSMIADKQLSYASEEALQTMEANIRTSLREPEATLTGIVYNIRKMTVEQNMPDAYVQDYIAGLSEWLLANDNRMLSHNGVYTAVYGRFIDGIDIPPPPGYVPEERPWYKNAVAANGDIAVSAPYADVRTGLTVMSLSQAFYDDMGNVAGVVAQDMLLTRLTEYVCNSRQSYGGYGMLLDENLTVVAHPDHSIVGRPFDSLNIDSKEVAEELVNGSLAAARHIRDLDGREMIVFFREMYNGWFVGTLTPTDSYYGDVIMMEAILLALGLVLMVLLCFMLLRLSAAKLRADEESRAKTSFLARMSHEIRTPMNAIIGASELILRRSIPEEVREDASAIRQASRSLLAIINDILDFSKIESDRMDICEEPFRLASLLQDVVSITRMRMGEKPIHFITNIDSKLPGMLIGDELRLRQVMLNLLSNAIKYTNEGVVSLTISGKAADGGRLMMCFAVADTGIGIQEENLQKLFGDFTQLDSNRTIGIEGTGLGLAISRRLCMLMGGDIAVSSVFGEGSVFTAKVPVRVQKSIPLAVVDEPQEHNVLVLEPRDAYASSIMGTMRNLGVSCSLAVGLREFTDALAQGNYTYAFVASPLFAQTLEILRGIKQPPELVSLTAFGTAAPAGARTLTLPAYCVSIANALNGTTETSAYGEMEKDGNSFIAPGLRVLIVDDIQTNLRVTQGLLAPYQMQVDVCLSGQEALCLARTNCYDLVFMDHMMPGMDGIEAAKRLRMYDGSVPIIALTANAVSGMREMFLENGFDDYLPKPVELSELNDILCRWVPLEKRMTPSDAAAVLEPKADAPSEPLTQSGGFAIAGVDIQRGIAMIGGDEADYREVLLLFCRDARERLPALVMPSSKDALLFVTHVHALKSASASIGAMELSLKAAQLEAAGREMDIDFMAKNMESFNNALTMLIKNIESAVAESSRFADEAPLDEEFLLKLENALQNEDVGKVDSLLKRLLEEAYSVEVHASLIAASDFVLASEFHEAALIVDGILRTNNLR